MLFDMPKELSLAILNTDIRYYRLCVYNKHINTNISGRITTPGKNYRLSTLRGYSLMFFYLAVNKLITDKMQNIFDS